MAFRARFVGGRPSLGPSLEPGGELPRALTVPMVFVRAGLGREVDGEVEGWASSVMVAPVGQLWW